MINKQILKRKIKNNYEGVKFEGNRILKRITRLVLSTVVVVLTLHFLNFLGLLTF